MNRPSILIQLQLHLELQYMCLDAVMEAIRKLSDDPRNAVVSIAVE
jgi:hypothetical protein